MHNITDKSQTFYVFIASKNITKKIGDKEALIKFLTSGYNNYYNYGYSISNQYFLDINASGSDTYWSLEDVKKYKEDEFGDIVEYKEPHYFKTSKEYLFFDGYDRIVDVRKYEKEVLKYKKCFKIKSYYDTKAKDNFVTGETYVRHIYRNNVQLYKFRRGSVPGISSRRRWNSKNSQLNFLRKELANKEYAPYVRAKRKNIIEEKYFYEDFRFYKNHNWKSESKCRHQWEKNLK